MGKEQFFIIGRSSPGFNWVIITSFTEDYDEARKWYDDKKKINRKVYPEIQIAKTIYG